MKTMLCCLLILSLAACQKEIQLPGEDRKTGHTTAATPPAPSPEPPACPLPEPPPADTVYRQEPNQVIIMSELAPMLWENKQYKITDYYSVKKDLWNELSSWLKDDVYTFHESGKGWIDAGEDQHPVTVFETLQRHWRLYGKNKEIKLDWVDRDYNAHTYSVVAYKIEESFTIRTMANDSSKIFYTFSYIGKK